MGNRGRRRIDTEAARHILIPSQPIGIGAILMDRSPPHHPASGFHAHCRFSRAPMLRRTAKRGGACETSPLRFNVFRASASHRGQKPFGVAKNSKTETFRRCRIW